MPRKKRNVLDAFSAFEVDFYREDGSNAWAECPFCGKEQEHFSVNVHTGQYGCRKCEETGNVHTWLGAVIEAFQDADFDHYRRLAKHRKNVAAPSAYRKGGFVWDDINNRWLLRINSYSGEVAQIRTMLEPKNNQQKMKLRNTKGLEAGLWGADRLARFPKARVWVCEGEWDGIALSWLFYQLGRRDEIVVAVPGMQVWKTEWTKWLSDRDVVLAYDADVKGDEGMRKVAYEPHGLKNATRTLQFLRWPLTMEDGYDVSDLIQDADSPEEAEREILSLVSDAIRTDPEPASTQRRRRRKGSQKKASFDDVVRVYSESLKMYPETINALRVTAGTVLTTQILGDPLWVFLVMPPGGGKTVLLNPYRSITSKCVFRSNLQRTTLVSGWQSNQDPSLIPKLDGLCLVLKDITELLQEAQHIQSEVFGVLQGIYDGYLDRSYGNAVNRKFESHFNAIAGVTTAIHGHQKANMGERWLKMQITRPEVRRHQESGMIQAALRNLGKEKEKNELMSEVMEAFLDRELDRDELAKKTPEWCYQAIEAVAMIIAKLRINVEHERGRDDLIKYVPEAEYATRLSKQLLKLLWGLVPSNPDGVIGGAEWAIVEQIAFDTAIGWNLDVVQAMMNEGGTMTRAEIKEATGMPRGNIERVIGDLEALRYIQREVHPDDKRNTYFKLVDEIQYLWNRAHIEHDHIETSRMVRNDRRGVKLRPRKKR